MVFSTVSNRPFHFLFPVFKIKGKCPVNDFLYFFGCLLCGKILGDYRWFNFKRLGLVALGFPCFLAGKYLYDSCVG